MKSKKLILPQVEDVQIVFDEKKKILKETTKNGTILSVVFYGVFKLLKRTKPLEEFVQNQQFLTIFKYTTKATRKVMFVYAFIFPIFLLTGFNYQMKYNKELSNQYMKYQSIVDYYVVKKNQQIMSEYKSTRIEKYRKTINNIDKQLNLF